MSEWSAPRIRAGCNNSWWPWVLARPELAEGILEACPSARGG
ncbi:hypothetical protein D3OALGB2SA_601 [Olavius algarvensis associated proteobacterium Delta 3]|nr:hypothetical protein D3OALGB2SA_601 [Olavius algarvensis associated proteobacterium Delta 3]